MSTKFKTSDYLKVGGGLLFFISFFMVWWGLDTGISGLGTVGWKGGHYFLTGIVPFLLLVAVAVPSYLGIRSRGEHTAIEMDLRSAVPAVEAYHADHGTYDAAEMTTTALRSYEPSLSDRVQVVSGSERTYCLSATRGGDTVYVAGPGAVIVETPCA